MAGYKRQVRPGTWELTVTVGSDFKGKPQRFYKTIKTDSEREAERELSRFFVQCEDGLLNASGVTTVAHLCDYYLREYADRFLKKSTRISTRATIKNWINPFLGKKKLSKLKRADVQQWVNYMSDEGKSAKTVRNCHSVLSSMFKYAVSNELMRHNPAADCMLPSLEKKEAPYYNFEELSQILEGLEQIQNDKAAYKCGILLAVFGGFRKAEILGFNWDDVDFDACTISVIRTRMREPGAMYEDTPKTTKSKRTISLPGFIFNELKNLKISQLEDKLKLGIYYADSQALLKQPSGEPITPDQFNIFFKKYCKSIGVAPLGLHALRHTNASILASIGANKVEVSKRLGHSNLTTTLNIYTHLFEEREHEIADKLETLKDRIAK